MPDRKGMSKNNGHKIKLKWGDITEVSGDVIATVWKDTQNIHTLTSMHSPPAQGNFCDEHAKAVKLAIVPRL
jgi:hypothetical protein